MMISNGPELESWRRYVRVLLEGNGMMDAQAARLEAELGNVHTATQDIKSALERSADKLDATNSRLDVLRNELNERIDSVRAELTLRLDRVRDDLARNTDELRKELTLRMEAVRDELTRKIESVRDELTSKLDSVRDELTGRLDSVRDELARRIETVRDELSRRIDSLGDKIDAVRDELYAVKASIASAKIWALSLYIALATGLLLVMARGFKWL
jgi:chromosome segregation ATPase